MYVNRLLSLTMGMLLTGLLVQPVHAQSPRTEVPAVTRTFAITDARVVQAPDRVLDRATVVVRDGLILAVGRDVEVPFDAERIAGDSLTVYAGFIDALSHTGIPEPEEEENQERVPEPGNPPNDRAGIQPERDARTLLKPDDASVVNLREAGFTVAQVVPWGGMLPGSSTIVLLAGDDPASMVLRGQAALVAQFDGANGVYPGTPMGIMAKLRQLYREAERRRQVQTLYAANAEGLERPPYDPAHEAFVPVIEGSQPIVFYTEGPLEVHRALALHNDLGFSLIVAGLEGSFDTVDALQESGAPALLSLKLPDLPKADSTRTDSTRADSTRADSTVIDSTVAEAAEPMTPQDPFISDFRTRSYEDIEAEETNLKARQALAREQHDALAGRLHEAGVPFGFMTMNLKPDEIKPSLTRMIEAGLPEEAALTALTTAPAQILGLSQSLGTIEAGKIANLVVTKEPYFDKDSQIRYVFVDGRKFDIKTSSPEENGRSEADSSDPSR